MKVLKLLPLLWIVGCDAGLPNMDGLAFTCLTMAQRSCQDHTDFAPLYRCLREHHNPCVARESKTPIDER